MEWGQSIDIKEFITYLNNLNHQISRIYSILRNVSLHPVGELGKALKTFNQDIYFVVDGVSCIGVDVNLERDYIDVLVSGSQKQLCCHLV